MATLKYVLGLLSTSRCDRYNNLFYAFTSVYYMNLSIPLPSTSGHNAERIKLTNNQMYPTCYHLMAINFENRVSSQSDQWVIRVCI